MSALVEVSLTPAHTPPATRANSRRQGSAKARNREVGHPTVQRALWGFRGGDGCQMQGLEALQRGSWVDLGCCVMRSAVNPDKM